MKEEYYEEIYFEGYDAFKTGIGVSSCPYLEDGSHNDIKSWLGGWQDSFNDFLGSFI